jgi:asparagine synthetase B (glutamine-hydrolysing)
VFGDEPEAGDGVEEDSPRLSPPEALERSLRTALARPPCAVCFSGGRDSSAVLAVAATLARREDLQAPVPVTLRFSEAPGTGETSWQELVVAHLGLADWIRLDVREELDLIGPVARPLLRRYGLLQPVHAHAFAFVLERSRCASLVTGFGGDQVLGGWLGVRLARTVRPSLVREALLLGYGASPASLRRLALRKRVQTRPWLTARARALVAERWLETAASEPSTYDAYLGWVAKRRSLAALRWNLARLGADAGAEVVHPLADPGFRRALARAGGRRGLGDRTAVMRALFGELLPDDVLTRESKAHFLYAYLRDTSRAFARSWDESGLDPELVDAATLRAAWLSLMPSGASGLALQAAWLASGDEIEQPPGGVPNELEATGPP